MPSRPCRTRTLPKDAAIHLGIAGLVSNRPIAAKGYSASQLSSSGTERFEPAPATPSAQREVGIALRLPCPNLRRTSTGSWLLSHTGSPVPLGGRELCSCRSSRFLRHRLRRSCLGRCWHIDGWRSHTADHIAMLIESQGRRICAGQLEAWWRRWWPPGCDPTTEVSEGSLDHHVLRTGIDGLRTADENGICLPPCGCRKD